MKSTEADILTQCIVVIRGGQHAEERSWTGFDPGKLAGRQRLSPTPSNKSRLSHSRAEDPRSRSSRRENPRMTFAVSKRDGV